MDEVARKKPEVRETEGDGGFRNVLQRPMTVYTAPIDWDWQPTPETLTPPSASQLCWDFLSKINLKIPQVFISSSSF